MASSVLADEMAEQPAVLTSVLRRNELLDGARAALAACTQVRLVGIGSSRHVASYGVACFEAFSPLPASLLPAPGAGIAMPAFGPSDALVVVSQSGITPALLPLVRDARRAGALVITVTNAEGSELEELADVGLRAHAGPERVIPATKSVTSSMLLLRALAGRTDGVASLAREAALVLDRTSEAGALPGVVVASGFAAEAVSDEVALKLAEVAAALAVPETVVDYLHGPAAVPARVLALLDPRDPNSAAVAALGDVLQVDLPGLGDPSLDAVLRVIAGQQLALQWAQERGLDPDDPRGLSKVTLTL